MKKTATLILICILAFVLAPGCGKVAVKKEFEKYKTLYVGWLDLDNQNYGVYGYYNRADWLREVANLNVNGLQKYTRDYMRGWEIIGATSKYAAPPRKAEMIVVKLVNPVLNQTTLSVRCGMNFYDGTSGKLLKHVIAESAPVAYGSRSAWGYYHGAVFGGRLMDVMYNLAYDINYYLTH